MTAHDVSELASLLDSFVDGTDTSLLAANRLEVVLAEAFPDDDVVQDRVGDLALYRPGGGEFLLDEVAMRSRLGRLRDYLTSQG